MAVISLKQLLDARLHYGHHTRRWNPKMKRFIHGERAGIHVVDLHQTLAHIERSYVFVRDLVAKGGTILFIGTKKQAQDSVQSYAESCNMPYVNERWLGGMLTNFQTISKRVSKMKEYQRMRDSGELDAMPKKEALLINRELAKLERNLVGIRDMTSLPNAIFVLDTKKEHIAVTEARKVGVPIVAVVDTNCDPDPIDFAIPGNDDAIRAGQLMCRVFSDAVKEGRFMHGQRVVPVEVPERTAEEEAEIALKQQQARLDAQAQAIEREARISQAQANVDTASDSDNAAAADTETALDTDHASKTGTEPASDTDTATETESASVSDHVSENEATSESDAASETDAASESDATSESDAASETDQVLETEGASESESSVETGTEAATEAVSESGTEAA